MLRRLYDWTLSLAAKPMAELWLFIIAFVESSIFLIPAETLFVPMAIAKPKRVWRFSLIASSGSILGGIAGWMIGYFAYESIAKPILEFYGKLAAFEALMASVDPNLMLLLLVTSGAAHLPPLKIVTILSGVMGVNLVVFIIAAIVARGGKFLLLGWLLASYGALIRDFIERRLKIIAAAVAALIIFAYTGYLVFLA